MKIWGINGDTYLTWQPIMYRKNGHDHDYEISDQRDKEMIWQYCILIISGEQFRKILFIDDFIPSRSLCIKSPA